MSVFYRRASYSLPPLHCRWPLSDPVTTRSANRQQCPTPAAPLANVCCFCRFCGKEGAVPVLTGNNITPKGVCQHGSEIVARGPSCSPADLFWAASFRHTPDPVPRPLRTPQLEGGGGCGAIRWCWSEGRHPESANLRQVDQ